MSVYALGSRVYHVITWLTCVSSEEVRCIYIHMQCVHTYCLSRLLMSKAHSIFFCFFYLKKKKQEQNWKKRCRVDVRSVRKKRKKKKMCGFRFGYFVGEVWMYVYVCTHGLYDCAHMYVLHVYMYVYIYIYMCVCVHTNILFVRYICILAGVYIRLSHLYYIGSDKEEKVCKIIFDKIWLSGFLHNIYV